MSPRPWIVSAALALLLLAGRTARGEGAQAALPGRTPIADTVLRPDLDRPPLAVRAGLVAPADAPHVTLGLRRIPVEPAGIGVLRPEREEWPFSAATAPFGLPADSFPLLARLGAGARRPLTAPPLTELVLRRRALGLEAPRPDTARFLPPVPAAPAPAGTEQTGRFVTEFADLAMLVRSRMEIGGDWTRFEPCDVRFQESCTPSLVPQLSPDFLFGVQLDGTIADRVRVDVDFDQAREFDGANRINIAYEGGEDDILRRLDVGDVTFRLPRSRFLTEGLPAGNFGFQAEGQFGPLEFQTVWAQQRGDLNARVFRLSGIGDQRSFVQEDTLVFDDADYVRGQFFFLFDPVVLDGWPHVDVLALDAGSAPPEVAPGSEPIQLYRYESDPVLRQQVEGFIQADATAGTGPELVVESGWFRYLQPGLDYDVHPSGLWVSLRQPLGDEQMLAVTYVTALGDTVGDYNPERLHNQGGRPTLSLLKASGANHRPGRPTWEREMHQIYRVSGSPDVEPGSVDVLISLGEPSQGRTFTRGPTGEDITFLRLFGLDEEAPLDRVDPSFLHAPGRDLFELEAPVQGMFLVFPTLRPFAEPPPVPSLGLSAEATAAILGDEANPRIYDEEDPFERENGGRFRLTIGYRIRSSGLISSFSLGAFGVREESERITLGDRLLTRGLDYEIDYDVGQVRLLDAEGLFAARPDAEIRASWEQRSLFEVSPTQMFGFRTHAALGAGGGLDLLGLYRSERSVVRRPILGTEPGAGWFGGVTSSYGTTVGWMDRLLDLLPGLRLEGPTTLDLQGELAFSAPDPNTRGVAFVDDFDAARQLPVALVAPEWRLGSAPAFRDGAETVLPPVLGPENAAPVVWQHRWIVTSASGDSVGVHEGFFARQDIDRQLRVAGAETREAGLLVTLGAAPDGGAGWRSITAPLAPNGLDLSRTEFLEVYVAGGEDVRLLLDLGTVSEDAFFVGPNGETSGTRADGRPWGLGILDQEADPARGELWSDAADELGAWGETCRAERGRLYPAGDPRAVCTRGNGRPDSEDLDSDGILDTTERHLRYVLELGGASPWLARTGEETGTDFELYRIPIRGGGATEVGGAIGDADLRAVRHLRLTVTAPGPRTVRLARMRLVGSSWIKRAQEGVLEGIAGDTLALGGRVEVASVSRVTEGAAYASPPGVLEELVDPTVAIAGQGIEFNEKSLGVTFAGLAPGTRAEVYQRFPQRPRNFLSYRQARLWAVAPQGDFGPERPTWFFVKVGNDADNFYLYRTRLAAPPGGRSVAPEDWLPEVRIDFDAWFELRQRAEAALLERPPGGAAGGVAVWSPDSTYAVVLDGRGRAPNLASVRELSLGVWNGGDAPISGEVWIDEFRLAEPVRTPGTAASLEVALDGGGALTSRLTVTNRGPDFRQLRAEPSYQTDRVVTLRSTLALDRWMPAGWAVEVPLTLDVDRVDRAPKFLPGSDLRADRLPDLRATASRRTRLGLGFRRRTPAANPWVGFFVDGLSTRAAWTRASGSTVTSRHRSEGFDGGLSWVRLPEERSVGLVPGAAEGVLRALLPGFLEDRVVESRLRLTPVRVSLGSSYLRQENRIFRFERIVTRPEEADAEATRAPHEHVEGVADVRLQPLRPLVADVTIATERDLLPAEEAVADPDARRLVERERARAAGVDLGWETRRSVRTRLAFTPRVVPWLRHDLDWATTYRSDRSANLVVRRETPDSGLAIARDARGQREWGVALALDVAALAAAAGSGASPGAEGAGGTGAGTALAWLRPFTVDYRSGVTSRFQRDAVDPGAAYQLGWGGDRSFLVLDGDTAATWTDRESWTFGSGLALPGSGAVQVAYRTTDALTLDVRSDRSIRQRTWPELQLRLPAFQPPSFTGVRSVSVASGVQRVVRETSYGGRALQARLDEDLRLPLDVTLSWVGTLVTSYQGSVRIGEAVDPTGDTERDETSHRLSVRSQWLPPGALGARLDRPIQLSALAGYVAERSCRSTRAGEGCVPFLDQIRRTVALAIDTTIDAFQVGMQVSFDDRQSFVGQRTGSTQLQVGIFGQLELRAGSLPTMP